jgi:hypothetical protein
LLDSNHPHSRQVDPPSTILGDFVPVSLNRKHHAIGDLLSFLLHYLALLGRVELVLANHQYFFVPPLAYLDSFLAVLERGFGQKKRLMVGGRVEERQVGGGRKLCLFWDLLFAGVDLEGETVGVEPPVLVYFWLAVDPNVVLILTVVYLYCLFHTFEYWGPTSLVRILLSTASLCPYSESTCSNPYHSFGK